MEERVGGPPRDGVERIDEVACPTPLFSVVLPSGVHPVDHLIHRVTGLVVAPIPVNQTAEPHGDRVEVVLERGVVLPCGRIFIDDDFRSVFGHPIVDLPRVGGVVNTDER